MTLNADRAREAEEWITSYLADLLDIPPAEVDKTIPFDQLGLDSAATVSFASDLGRWLGVRLDSRVLFEFDTVQAVARHLRETAQASA